MATGKNPPKPKVVVLGSVNMDLVATMRRMPDLGETVAGDGFFTAGGGKGANQAVALARLGADVRMVGKVGDDDFGRALLDGLRAEGVDVHDVALDAAHSTGVAIILVDAAGQNRIAAVYGANMACDKRQLAAAKRAMNGADILMLQLETPPEISVAAAMHARSIGVRVVWDPAPAAAMPDDGFATADILTPNEIEAAELTGISVKGVQGARDAAKSLLAKGVGVAVVKLGQQGVYAASADKEYFVPPLKVDMVDSVAAGDAFGAGLAVALAEGNGIDNALKFGAAAGALAVTKPGARDAMPFRTDVESLLAQSP
ncbi:MAG: ribokinase [Chloroflexi bacterium]|nr:ribokinase [Chloroflexota bacterium]